MYHFEADAAEHLHHKDNARLQSQVRALPAWTLSPTLPGISTEHMQLLGRMCIMRKTSGTLFSLFIGLGKYEPCFHIQAFQNSHYTRFKTYNM